MAGESPELSELAGRMAAFDDDALAAIANRGLVRRARKDLEKSRPQYTGSTGDQLAFDVGGCRVLLGVTPAAAICTCGAGSTCRHVLATVIYLREHAAAACSAAVPAAQINDLSAEIMSITADVLEKWAGKAVLRRALSSPREDVHVELGNTLVIQLPLQNTTVRWLPGLGLTGMLCSCHAGGPCEHKVAAVLAFWAREGRVLPAPTEKGLSSAAGAPRTRAEVLNSVQHVLHEMITLGLQRVSDATAQRLKTLAVSAHGVDFPRLERFLNGLATEIALLLKRDAQGAAGHVLHAVARAWALTAALARPTPALVGVHRTKYERVSGELDLSGLGARQWRTRSGYEGLTVYFWEAGSQTWNTWSDARPVGLQFQPAARYTQEFPWAGVRDPQEASRSRYRIAGLYRNPVGRLSGRSGARAMRMSPSAVAHVPAIRRWPDLLPRLERAFGGGLGEQSEQDEIVLLAPAEVQDAAFDEVGQVLHRPLIDTDGRNLPLLLRHDELTPEAIGHLESVRGDDLIAVLGLLRVGPDGVYVEPITLATSKGLLHITLDGAACPAAQPPAPAAKDSGIESAGEGGASEDEVQMRPRSPVGLLLQQALECLEDCAEAGLRAPHDLHPLRASARALEVLGLETCRRAVISVADALDHVQREQESPDGAPRLLDTAYVLRLAIQQETLALWARQLA